MADKIEGTANAAESAPGMPQLDFSTFPNQIFWLVVTLIVLYLVLSRVALPRIATVLSERHGAIQRDLDKAEEMKRSAIEAENTYNQALADARVKANDIVNEAKAEIQKDLDKAIAKADLQTQPEKQAVNLLAGDILERKIAFNASTFQIEHDESTGFDLVDIKGHMPLLKNSETPVLAYQSEKIFLPPDAEIMDVKLLPIDSEDLGVLNLPGFRRGLGLPGVSLGEFVTLNNASGTYPRDMVEFEVAILEHSKVVNLVYYPLTFNADTSETSLVKAGELAIQYRTAYKGVGDYLVTDKTGKFNLLCIII